MKYSQIMAPLLLTPPRQMMAIFMVILIPWLETLFQKSTPCKEPLEKDLDFRSCQVSFL